MLGLQIKTEVEMRLRSQPIGLREIAVGVTSQPIRFVFVFVIYFCDCESRVNKCIKCGQLRTLANQLLGFAAGLARVRFVLVPQFLVAGFADAVIPGKCVGGEVVQSA